jgi:glycosyltransferase involved in cell wall biosynthesis
MMASVDVVVPCYQYGRFLRDCVTSVLTQDIGKLRVLIIDNASTDDSLEVAQQLAAEDARVEVIAHPTNKGATYSYNEGIDWAAADYFILIDADDLMVPRCLSRAVAVLQEQPEISFTHGMEARLLPDGSIGPGGLRWEDSRWTVSTGREFIERLCRTPVNNVGANTVVRRTSAQKRVGYYSASLPYSDDLEMWLRLATVGSVASTPTVQAIRRYHDARMSAGYDGVGVSDFTEREAAFEGFFHCHGHSLSNSKQLLRAARTGLGQHAYWSAVSHFFRGRTRAALMLLRYALRKCPSVALFPPVSWVFRMDRPLARITEVASQAILRRC